MKLIPKKFRSLKCGKIYAIDLFLRIENEAAEYIGVLKPSERFVVLSFLRRHYNNAKIKILTENGVCGNINGYIPQFYRIYK